MKNTDFSMYRYYKGESENPLPNNDAALWWNYEQIFEEQYQRNDASDWNAFFDFDYNPKFWAILENETSDEKPQNKGELFGLWLDKLIVGHLCENGIPKDIYLNSYNNSVKE